MSEVFGDIGIGYEFMDDTEGLPRYCYYRAREFTVCGNNGDRVDEIILTLGLS